jgi:hypothetical protein
MLRGFDKYGMMKAKKQMIHPRRAHVFSRYVPHSIGKTIGLWMMGLRTNDLWTENHCPPFQDQTRWMTSQWLK